MVYINNAVRIKPSGDRKQRQQRSYIQPILSFSVISSGYIGSGTVSSRTFVTLPGGSGDEVSRNRYGPYDERRPYGQMKRQGIHDRARATQAGSIAYRMNRLKSALAARAPTR